MYRYTEEDKAIIAEARKANKDKRAEKRLYAMELRARGKSAAVISRRRGKSIQCIYLYSKDIYFPIPFSFVQWNNPYIAMYFNVYVILVSVQLILFTLIRKKMKEPSEDTHVLLMYDLVGILSNNKICSKPWAVVFKCCHL